MGIEAIKEIMEKEEAKMDRPEYASFPIDHIDSVFEYMDDPEAENGLPMGWNSVALTLKPEKSLP